MAEDIATATGAGADTEGRPYASMVCLGLGKPPEGAEERAKGAADDRPVEERQQGHKPGRESDAEEQPDQGAKEQTKDDPGGHGATGLNQGRQLGESYRLDMLAHGVIALRKAELAE